MDSIISLEYLNVSCHADFTVLLPSTAFTSSSDNNHFLFLTRMDIHKFEFRTLDYSTFLYIAVAAQRCILHEKTVMNINYISYLFIFH